MKKIITSSWLEKTAQTVKIPPGIKNKVNKALADVGKKYWDAIPIVDISGIMSPLGLELVNEDGTPFSAFFTGEEGRASIDLKLNGQQIKNCVLSMQWYKMPSGRYEIVAYLS